ncbi:NapC/NirT family cytochrome c [bacterium]|nr:NapC/NirT family cytochrome c [bacterium]MBU1025022.1 NapC/NirT family cytochrome c [bacterium]
MKLYNFIKSFADGLETRWQRIISKVLRYGIVLVLLFVVVAFFGLEMSARPQFCITCHYMKPFYDSWEKSVHNEVKCVECHYPPGLKSEIEGKFVALNQITKYITQQYGTRPPTQVEDASCLRPGCHQTRLLQGKVEFGNVQFDHLPHLTSYRRVTRLRCTSCHSQMVQGNHMAVTQGTCFTCHFKLHKGQETELSDCTMCHKLPFDPQLVAFNHDFVKDRGIDCRECHADVIHGEGEVPKARCVLCHSEEDKVERYYDVAFIHENHVTEHKITCSQCHNEILHYSLQEEHEESLDMSVGSCTKCHETKHALIYSMYSGRGIEGIDEGPPDYMFAARVTCKGCHRSYLDSGDGSVFTQSGAGGCMLCHGEEYGKYLTSWNIEFDQPLKNLKKSIENAENKIISLPNENSAKGSALAKISLALKEVDFIENAKGVHNSQYSRQLMQSAADKTNDAMKSAGIGGTVDFQVISKSLESSRCSKCHFKVPDTTFEIFNMQFSHVRHVSQAGLSCEVCHKGGRPENPDHGDNLLDLQGCRNCHEKAPSASPHQGRWMELHKEEAKSNSQSCTVCHDKKWCSSCHGVTMPHPGDWKDIHGETAVANRSVCNQCHKNQMCSNCHKVQMPHPDNWLAGMHGKTFRDNSKVCWQCHENDTCSMCHESEIPHPENWMNVHHVNAVKSPADCGTCHKPSDCRICHNGHLMGSHQNNWATNHTKTTEEEHELCALCHEKSKGDVCTSCHGVAIPHPDEFAFDHKSVASFEPDSVCFKCHDKESKCAECHDLK